MAIGIGKGGIASDNTIMSTQGMYRCSSCARVLLLLGERLERLIRGGLVRVGEATTAMSGRVGEPGAAAPVGSRIASSCRRCSSLRDTEPGNQRNSKGH